MRILVTGATGFLGGHVVQWLAAKGHTVVATGRRRMNTTPPGVTFQPGDLEHVPFCLEVTKDIDAIIHCAAKVGSFGDYQDFFRGNVLATEALAKAAIAHKVPTFIHIGTPSIYFDGKSRRMIKESDPLPQQGHTHYATTKLLAEQALDRLHSPSFRVMHLRPRGIFGKGDTAFLGRFLPLIRSGKLPLIAGGTSLIDLTYVDNVCHAIDLALVAPDRAYGEAYNITNDQPMTLKDLTTTMANILGVTIRQIVIPYPIAMLSASFSELWALLFKKGTEPKLTRYSVGLMSRDQTLDLSKAKQNLKYRPIVSLEQGLRIFLEHNSIG